MPDQLLKHREIARQVFDGGYVFNEENLREMGLAFKNGKNAEDISAAMLACAHFKHKSDCIESFTLKLAEILEGSQRCDGQIIQSDEHA